MRRGFLALVAALVVCAACSSTSEVRSSRSKKNPATATTGQAQSSSEVGSSDQAVPSADAAQVSVDGSRIGGGRIDSGARGADPTATPSPPSAGTGGRGAVSQGVSHDSISIGIRYYPKESIQAFTVAYGMNAGALPDPRGYAEAVVAHINAGGGMHGLKVKPVYVPVDAQRSAAEVDRVDQESCSAMTEDTKVFAAVTSMPGNIRTFAPCMAAHNTPVVTDPLLYVDKAFLDRIHGFLYMPTTPEAGRMARFWIDGLARAGYFSKGARVGLVRYDESTGAYERTAKNAIVPALARHGLKLTRDFVVSNYLDSSQFANAVLQMKTARVTHLLVMDVSSLISFFFMTHAETQGYRPAYGLNSFSVGTFLDTNAPEAQLRNAFSVGWLPSWDVTAPESPPLKDNEKACLSILAKAGQRVDSQVAKALAFSTCDTLFFLDAAVDRATVLNPAGLSAAVDGLGVAYSGVGTFGTRFAPGRHDGPTSWRLVRYDGGCACLRYRGGDQPAN